MKRWMAVSSVVIGVLAADGCNRQDADRARTEGREAQEKAQRQLEITKAKLRENLKHADAETREDLDKARDQLHQALNQSESDAEKARDKLRERDSHQ